MIDEYWAAVDAALTEVRQATTVDEVIDALNRHHQKSSGDAFFAGDYDDMYCALMFDAPRWGLVWSEAAYYWCARDSQGNTLSYVEGDVYRGNVRRAG